MSEAIVFFDIDGTLLNEEKILVSTAKEAIAKLQQQGIRTAIATGRGPFMFRELRETLGIDTFVSYNGQYVEVDGKRAWHNPLRAEDLAALEEKAESHGHAMVFMTTEQLCANRPNDPLIDKCIASLKVDMPVYAPKAYLNTEVYQALLFCEDEHEHLYEKFFNTHRFVRWHEHCTDVLPREVSKVTGIKHVISKLGLSMDQVFAFGDGLNDVEMLEAAGTGVAMGDAAEEVKAKADYVTGKASEDGIASGLKHLGLL